jgi:hypothetical protein
VGLALAVLLASCSSARDQPYRGSLPAALRSLNAQQSAVSSQLLLARSPADGHFSRQFLLRVAVPDAPGYRIVDPQGEIFASYDEFLADNTLPDQLGPG